MRGRERILAVLSGKATDHLGLMPITMTFAADAMGVKYRQYAGNYRTLVEAQIYTAEKFGFDHVSAVSDGSREAGDRGATIHWTEDQPPSLLECEALLADKTDFDRIRALDIKLGRRMEDRVRSVELMHERVGKTLIVEGWVEGPCAEAADLRGLNNLLTDLEEDPTFVEDLFEYVVDGAITFARAQIQAGADIIGVSDAIATLVDPNMYRETVWHWQKKLVEAIHAQGGKVRLHICGNTRPILSEIGELGCDIVDLDYSSPLQDAREAMGPSQVLAGNLDPVRELKCGTPPKIARMLQGLHQQAGDRWIIAAGCEIPRETPHENVHALAAFARNATTAAV